MFSRSGEHKTKETYPTRPGSPTPCKEGLKLPIKILLTHAGERIFVLFAGIFFKVKSHGNLTDFTLDNNETIKSVIPGEISFCDSTGIRITAVQRPMSYQNGDLSGQKLAGYYSRSRMHTLILYQPRVVRLVNALPSVADVPSSIPGDIASFLQLLCSFD